MILKMDESRKQVCIWLDSSESAMAMQEGGLKEQMENFYSLFRTAGIGVTVFYSGHRDLYEATQDLLKKNLSQ